MSFVDQDNRREKSLSGIGSALLVAGIGYALVTGLAVNIIRLPQKELWLHNYSDPPPPPEHQPTKPTARASTVATTTTPPKTPDVPLAIIELHTIPTPPIPTWQTDLVGPLTGGGGAETTSKATAAQPRGRFSEWVTTEDYPQAALRAGAEGRTSFRLDIGTDGRVADCAITQSSGSADLDRAACRVLRRTARFTPARDAAGNPVASSYANNVVWKLPSE